MSDSTQSTPGDESWSEHADELNESFFEAFEQNMQMQTEFLDSWRESLDESGLDESTIEGMAGTSRAYEVWMEAIDAQLHLVSESLSGEDVDLEAFRDIWLDAANDAFKEVMGTSAFAAATGQTVGDLLEAGEQFDQMRQDALGSAGFATADQIEEVGGRLVELERRQHAVERKLDRVIELLDEEDEGS